MTQITSKKISILGYGEMGHAMQCLLQNRHQLFIWDRYPLDGITSLDLQTIVPQSDVILFCLPVNPHREVLAQITEYLRPDSLCLSIAKGLDESGNSAAQIFQQQLAAQNYALMYGPMISEEILAGRAAFAQLGCVDHALFSRIRELYRGSPLYLQYSADISGISWSVILKNVYAMLFGMADELQLGDNMRGFLAVTALHELEQIVLSMGGEARSPFHLAGLGDLITTATSEDSHHHELGRRLARGETDNISGEGVHTLQMVNKFNLFDQSAYPLFRLVDAIVNSPQQLRARITAYLDEEFG